MRSLLLYVPINMQVELISKHSLRFNFVEYQ